MGQEEQYLYNMEDFYTASLALPVNNMPINSPFRYRKKYFPLIKFTKNIQNINSQILYTNASDHLPIIIDIKKS